MSDESGHQVRSAHWRRAVLWALLGGVSGLAATLAVFAPRWIGIDFDENIRFGPMELSFAPLSLGPGFVFGLIAGLALRRAGHAPGWRYPAYIAAATVSYFAAVQLSLNVLIDAFASVVAVGVVAGLFGAALLTGLSAALMPCFRRLLPVIATIAAGGVFGAFLHFSIVNEGFLTWLALFLPWQAGYAAAMATALPDTAPPPYSGNIIGANNTVSG